MLLGWITSFNTDRRYEPREVTALAQVASGKRADYVWVRLSPRLEPGDARNAEPLEVALLAPRHAGDSLSMDPVGRPIHVYICTVRGAGTTTPSAVDPKAVDIRHWAVVYPTFEEALTAGG